MEFSFTVTLGDDTFNGTYGGMDFHDGVATFTLKGGETKTATGLPTTLGYTVTQEDADGFDTEKTGDAGTISTTTPDAEFTNTRETGDLTVTNTVHSALSTDAGVEFSFTVTLGDDTFNGTYGGMDFHDGVATFTLKGGETKTATGLPTTLGYTVTQEDADGFDTEKTGDAGTISTTTPDAEFTNTRETGDLTVSNTVVSELSADADVEFEFTVTLDDTTINGTYGDMDFHDGVATVTLKGGESAEATGLPTTLGYTITQADAPGFVTTGKIGDTGTISTTASQATFTNTRQTYTITFVNWDGSELQSSDVAFGQTPVYTGETPTKASTAQYTYTFRGWDPEIVPVTGDAIYTATYNSVGDYGCLTYTETGDPATSTIVFDGNSVENLTLDKSVTGQVSLIRSFTTGVMATVCLPFEVTSAQKNALGTFYQFGGLKDGTTDIVTMVELGEDDALAANTAYILYPTADTSAPIDFGQRTISASPAPVEATGTFAFQGTYNYKIWQENDTELTNGVYGFLAEPNAGRAAGQFVKCGKNAYINPFRAYLKYTGELTDTDPTSKARRVKGDVLPSVIRIEWISATGEVTGISTVSVDYVGDGWYSLDGLKLNGEPTKKGLYIHKGKTVVIK